MILGILATLALCAAVLAVSTLAYLGARFLAMHGWSIDACLDAIEAWHTRRDAETDDAIRRGMRALTPAQVDELLAPLPPITQRDFRVTARGYVTYEPDQYEDGRSV